jgi:formamidopyrimidine-DNA glycosylase
VPELPEVETTRRGIRGALRGRRITGMVLREARLRWPVDPGLVRELPGQQVRDVRRRAKYLLIELERGTLIAHLGMSGSLRVLPPATPLLAHDHYDLLLDTGRCLRFNDPRRFGSLIWVDGDPAEHPLLAALGPEPLERGFDADYLHGRSRGRKVAIKQFLMDQHVVVGVGNIYASEALFRAGIHPRRAAGRVSRVRLEGLVAAVRAVLREAIRQGGTTLRDYVNAEGAPGYFRQELYVYERQGEPCRNCGTAIRQVAQGQRSTYFCPRCQA